VRELDEDQTWSCPLETLPLEECQSPYRCVCLVRLNNKAALYRIVWPGSECQNGFGKPHNQKEYIESDDCENVVADSEKVDLLGQDRIRTDDPGKYGLSRSKGLVSKEEDAN